jgi:hypothetical protein
MILCGCAFGRAFGCTSLQRLTCNAFVSSVFVDTRARTRSSNNHNHNHNDSTVLN